MFGENQAFSGRFPSQHHSNICMNHAVSSPRKDTEDTSPQNRTTGSSNGPYPPLARQKDQAGVKVCVSCIFHSSVISPHADFMITRTGTFKQAFPQNSPTQQPILLWGNTREKIEMSHFFRLITAIATLTVVSAAQAEIPWQVQLSEAHAKASREGKPLLLHFYAEDCVWCEKLEKGAFASPIVAEAINASFIPVKVHANTSPSLAKMFKVDKFPTDVVVTQSGKTVSHAVSPQDVDRYVEMLQNSLVSLEEISDQEIDKNETPLEESEQKSTLAIAQGTAEAESVSDLDGETTSSHTASRVKPTEARFATLGMKDDSAALTTTRSAETPPPEYATLEKPFSPPPSTMDMDVQDGISGGSPAMTLPPDMPAVPSGQQNAAAESSAAGIEIPTKTPASQPELALEGFCAVTVIKEDQWLEGDPSISVIHLGKLYLFSSIQKRDEFLADPIPFTPVLNEIDPVVFFEERRIVPGKREWGMKDPIHQRMFFFADEASMNHFYQQYERYTQSAIDLMDRAIKESNPGI